MSNEPHKRRWYQFSLRTLLIVMLLFSVTVGWIGSRIHRARENLARVTAVEDAVAWVEKSGGKVVFEKTDLRPQSWLESQFDDPGGPENPVGVLNVTRVELRWTPVTDADLRHLVDLKSLQELNISKGPYGVNISNAEVTDAGLEHLKGLTKLQVLWLPSPNVTDAGLEHLKGLTNLQELVLQRANITGAGLVHLKGLTQLKRLYLAHTQLTDAGLEHLKTLTQLEELNLTNTKVTYAGVEKLQQALPNCAISANPEPPVIEPKPIPNPFE